MEWWQLGDGWEWWQLGGGSKEAFLDFDRGAEEGDGSVAGTKLAGLPGLSRGMMVDVLQMYGMLA